MSDQFVQLPIDSTGKKIDTSELTVGANTVERERVNLSDPTDVSGHAKVLSAAPVGTEYGLVVRPANATPSYGLSSVLTAWNSGTSVNTTQTLISVAGAPALIIQLDQTTTITVGAITFEESFDGINWTTLAASQVIDPSALTQISLPYTLQASTNKAFMLLTAGAQGIRIKLSTAITGSGTVTPYLTVLSYEPMGYAAALPLPSGAATSAKQPVLGTAGSASADVISIQGVASMTAVKVDGSGVTQPVQVVGNGTLLSNQQAVTATAVALASNACRKVAVKALVANTINVYVGPSGVTTSTGYELAPGEAVSLDITNVNLVFVIASTTGASISWVATN